MPSIFAMWEGDSWEVLDSDWGFFWKIEIDPFQVVNVSMK